MGFDINKVMQASQAVEFEEDAYDKTVENKRQEIEDIEKKYDQYFTKLNDDLKKAITKKHNLIVKMMREDDSWRKDHDAC